MPGAEFIAWMAAGKQTIPAKKVADGELRSGRRHCTASISRSRKQAQASGERGPPVIIEKESFRWAVFFMFELSVEQTFAAGHALRNYKGKCENVHGHNYRVRVVVQGAELDHRGLLVDFGDIKKVMKKVIERLDHQFLNDVPPFTEWNPTAENLALYFYQEVSKGLEGVAQMPLAVSEVNVWETDIQNATYRP